MSWATIRIICLGIALALGATMATTSCAGDDGDTRLIQTNDPEFDELEAPETTGECAANTDCEPSCLHACVPETVGPVTCPADPPPVPERVATADCVCSSGVCAWFP